MTDQNYSVGVIDLNDQTVLVSSDVKHDELADLISAAECGPEVGEVTPSGLTGDVVPVRERRKKKGGRKNKIK